MTPFDRWLLIVANLLAGGTGVIYGWFRYFTGPVDEFSLVHPWQPAAHTAHVLAAPLLAIVIGHFFYHHALLSWKAQVRTGKRSGLTMLALALPMIVSGYLLQISVHDGWRNAWIIVHVATALIWLTGCGAHLFTHARHRQRVRAEDWRPE